MGQCQLTGRTGREALVRTGSHESSFCLCGLILSVPQSTHLVQVQILWQLTLSSWSLPIGGEREFHLCIPSAIAKTLPELCVLYSMAGLYAEQHVCPSPFVLLSFYCVTVEQFPFLMWCFKWTIRSFESWIFIGTSKYESTSLLCTLYDA